LFESAVDGFRDSLRETVGADASEIFKSLTTEQAYQGLMIDENYGLALLDSNAQPVPGRSAGAEQIVALSLIGGLNRAAVREGPVVMDSNFARLDRGHRKNVIRFLPQLGPQVIVLVHSGEIDKHQDLAEPGVNIARRYEVVRVTETRSRIVPEAV
jgi:DNA sulfur modification protein DndD